ncbi:hypothetical protein [Hydrogenophaga sp. PBL-H3]|uniref:hypothetical protein n=1 Tax=Hydrogenophaga sp. PBL-H3 TaxID=434010 RepID=UPI00132055AB|nr:hypothetical protein [Hydrogenophaga sp. PBL-H3]QHE78550.1 hypothetical protein F9Z45_20585 [Hydrogenophaga sp. PBL-H3]QHE82975.1 hypothetical protein F9Z44_20585 [Hydrogenophaga sp. PBL-H3]
MSQADITRLVVGEPITIALGQPVGQALAGARDLGSGDLSKTLRWSDGKWMGQESLLDKFTRAKRSDKLVIKPLGAASESSALIVVPPKVAAIGAAILVASAALVVATFAGIGPFVATAPEPVVEAEQPLPFAPPSEPSPVRSINEPFGTTAAGQTGLSIIQQVDGAGPGPSVAPLPFDGPSPTMPLVASVPDAPPMRLAPTKVAPSPPDRSASAREPDKDKAGKEDEPKRNRAVILDEGPDLNQKPASKPTTAAKPEATAAATVAKPATSPAVPQVAATAPAVPAPPALKPSAGLVAITPDGKAALFTNPSTRLPQQFKVGDKLPSGETIKSIDASNGKVTTATKEYGLD